MRVFWPRVVAYVRVAMLTEWVAVGRAIGGEWVDDRRNDDRAHTGRVEWTDWTCLAAKINTRHGKQRRVKITLHAARAASAPASQTDWLHVHQARSLARRLFEMEINSERLPSSMITYLPPSSLAPPGNIFQLLHYLPQLNWPTRCQRNI